ncbi:MAG: hypothetical protein HRU35_01450 [Rickettsiaceae bacterium]|nr:hypothetical protein [Rickettsiaceae bacterium]
MPVSSIYNQPTNIYESDINYHNNKQLHDNKVKFNELLEETEKLKKRGAEYGHKKSVTDTKIKNSTANENDGTDIALKELASTYTQNAMGTLCNMMFNTGNEDKSFAYQVFSEELVKSLVQDDMGKDLRDNIYKELKSKYIKKGK